MQYRILGPLEVADGPRLLDLGGPKQRAVLAALLVEAGQVVSLSRLIDELWEGEPPPRATASLQAYISNLRRELEPDRVPRSPARVLVTQPPGYVLRVDPDDIDASRFEALLARGRGLLQEERPEAALSALSDALSLWHGPALADLAAEPFAEVEATRLEELRLTAVESRLEAELACGQHAAVVPELDFLVHTYRYRERLWELLLLALYRCGRQADALAAFQDARAILAEQLGIDPGPALQQLQGDILRQSPSLDWHRPPAERPLPPSPTRPLTAAVAPQTPVTDPEGGRLVGRDPQVARVQAVFDGTVEHGGRLQLLTGEPGIGKTRLAEELAAYAQQQGAAVVWGRSFEGEGAPAFWPWIQVFRGLVALPEGREALARHSGDLSLLVWEAGTDAGGPAGTDPQAARARLYDSAYRFLVGLAAVRPLVIILDDLQWADVPSLELLRFVATQLRDAQILVIAIHRDVESHPRSPLAQTLGALAHEPIVRRMTLEGLEVDAVGQFLHQVTGMEPPQETVDSVHRRTDGNPFFLVELVRLLDSQGATRDWTAMVTMIPVGVRDVLRSRLARLPGDTVTALVTAAVIGRDFELRVLERVRRESADEMLELLDSALVTGLIEESTQPAGSYRFVHDLVRETLRAEVSSARRARLHAAIAAALEEIHGPDDPEHVHQIAGHLLEAATGVDPGRIVAALVRSADRAIAELDYEHARDRLTCGVTQVARMPAGPDQDRAELAVQARLGLIQMMTLGYAAEETGAAFGRARRASVAIGAGDDVVSALWGSFSFWCVRGEFAAALDLAHELLELGARDSDSRAVMGGHQTAGIVCWHTGRLQEGAQHLAESVRIADGFQLGSLTALFQQEPQVTSRSFLAAIQGLRGEWEEAERLTREALELADALRHPYTAAPALFHAARHAVLARNLDRAARHAEVMIDLSTRRGYTMFPAMGRIFAGWILAHAGGAAAAADQIRDAIQAFCSTGARMLHHYFYGLLAEVELQAGRLEQALAAVDRGLRESTQTGERFHLPELHRVRGEIHLGISPDRASEADACFQRALLAAREQGSATLERRVLERIQGGRTSSPLTGS
jgi:predicted ATPase/DNA-binding SARP family transcriptional activator